MEERGIGKVVKGVSGPEVKSRGKEGLTVLMCKGIGGKEKCNISEVTHIPRYAICRFTQLH